MGTGNRDASTAPEFYEPTPHVPLGEEMRGVCGKAVCSVGSVSTASGPDSIGSSPCSVAEGEDIAEAGVNVVDERVNGACLAGPNNGNNGNGDCDPAVTPCSAAEVEDIAEADVGVNVVDERVNGPCVGGHNNDNNGNGDRDPAVKVENMCMDLTMVSAEAPEVSPPGLLVQFIQGQFSGRRGWLEKCGTEYGTVFIADGQ